jgi:hypothetical protein
LFGVSSSDAVLGLASIFMNDSVHLVPNFVAVGQAARGAGISGGNDTSIFGNDTTGSSSIARTARTDHLGYL